MNSPQAKTGVEVERLPELVKQLQIALDAGPTDGNWELCYLDTPLEQVGAYVQKCVEVSGGDKYHFIRGIRPDGVPIDVAHYGNGPTSNINGHWATVTRPENIRQLLAALAAERAEIERLMGDLRASEEDRLELHKANRLLADEAVRMRKCLQWYADGNHFMLEDWDTVSGEPQNWLEGPEGGMVEDGGVARTVLDGGYMVEGDDEIICEPMLTKEQHASKLARIQELMARDPSADSADGLELDQLAGQVERYEKYVYGAALIPSQGSPR